MARFAVVGGGITGLAAAYELSASGQHEVVVFEADTQLGGKLKASPFAGLDSVDEGADAFLARVPWGVQLARELGLADTLTSPNEASAFVAWNGRLERIPDGLVLGVPKGLGGLARSRLLGVGGKARAAIEPLLPRRSTAHDSLGRLVRERFGDQVLERLVDPLVGSINAGDADQLSLADSVPQLASAAANHRSLLIGLRRVPAAPAGPVFYAPRAGMRALVDGLVAELSARGTRLLTSTPVHTIVGDGRGGVRVDDDRFDGMVLATPAHVAATQLQLDGLRSIPYAGVVMLTMTVDGTVPHGSGYLVPKPQQRHVTAASFASHKWAHWQPPAGQSLLRVSLGRHGNEAPLGWDDDRIVRTAVDELAQHLGHPVVPISTRITRWERAFPQYLPGHGGTVTDVTRALPSGIVLAGAAYRGIGVPACIRQGREAANALTQRVGGEAE